MPGLIPNEETMKRGFELTSNCPEGAQYMSEAFKERMAKEKKMDRAIVASMQAEVDNHAERVHMQNDRSSPWNPDTVVGTDFQNMHRRLAQEAVKSLPLENNEIGVNYTMNGDAAFMRYLSLNGNQPSESESKALGLLLNAFLAKEGYVSKGSQLFQADEHGTIKKDASGNPVKADPEAVKNCIDTKLNAFIAETVRTSAVSNKTCDVTTKSHPFPAKAPVIADATPPPKAPVADTSVEKKQEQEQEITPETPDASQSMGTQGGGGRH